jgi:hypothetical protein
VEDVGVCYGHFGIFNVHLVYIVVGDLVYFTAILVFFLRFGML